MKLFQLMMSKVSILISVKDIEYNGQLFPLFLDACCDRFSNLSRLKKESKRSRLFTFLLCKHVYSKNGEGIGNERTATAEGRQYLLKI